MSHYVVIRKSDGKKLRFRYSTTLKTGESIFVLPRSRGGFVIWAKDTENRDVVIEVPGAFS